ncbi:DJ-1 family glyoxalase III [Salidesulfovibrio onnuriiensis]|uniref:DJ-1 family glyoxalase III n=1 Tax=Salidesulfovibrio onnuriiensis TaxID=2583823 RepID=UPI0011C70015|nr:DJ-1 family glyoxalase III [Salidesulfovibrio onnuriiensis]
MSKTVLVPLARGFEEVEALSIVDVLRRAGAEVTIAALGTTREVTSSHNVTVVADAMLNDCAGPYDLIALPGGIPGSEHLAESAVLEGMLHEQDKAGRLIGAICAAPAVVLQKHGIIRDRKATCYPSFANRLEDKSHTPERVVRDGNLITGAGAGPALEFGLKLAEALFGGDKARELQEAMLIR